MYGVGIGSDGGLRRDVTMEVWRHGGLVASGGLTSRAEPLALAGYYRKAVVKGIPLELGVRAGALLDRDDHRVRGYAGIGGGIRF